MVSTTLSQHQLNSINFAGFIEMQMQTMESPWLHPRFLHEMQEAVSTGLHGINSEHANKIKEIMECSNCSNIAANNMLNQLDAKDIWNAFSESDRKSRMRDYLLQHQAVLLGQSFMDLLHSVWHYQEDEQIHIATSQVVENEDDGSDVSALTPSSVEAVNILDERTINASGNVVSTNSVDMTIDEMNNILEEMDEVDIFEGLTTIIRENVISPSINPLNISNPPNAPNRPTSQSRVFDQSGNILQNNSMSQIASTGIELANNVRTRSSARIAAQRQPSG
tara:strand:- start:367 stop:1203 length:837 start_codon:yes stop_codon:yes gene_type:complete